MSAGTIPARHPSERRIEAAGFTHGRADGDPDDCPFPLHQVGGRVVGRKALIWLHGFVEGQGQLEDVRADYRTAVAALDGPQRNCWGGEWGG